MTAELTQAIDAVCKIAKRDRDWLISNHAETRKIIDRLKFDVADQIARDAYFEKTMNSYSASDYAGMQGGGYSFYYGYETQLPEDQLEHPDDENPWYFEVKNEKNEVLWRRTAEQLNAKQAQFNCPLVLLAGIGEWLNVIKPKLDKLREAGL